MTKLDWDKVRLREADPARVQQSTDFVTRDVSVVSVTTPPRPHYLDAMRERVKEVRARQHSFKKANQTANKIAKATKSAEVDRLLRR